MRLPPAGTTSTPVRWLGICVATVEHGDGDGFTVRSSDVIVAELDGATFTSLKSAKRAVHRLLEEAPRDEWCNPMQGART